MSLMKWFRKNNKKIFGVATVFILFGFMGLGQVMRHANQNRIETEATYGSGQKITNLEMHNARAELELLSHLGGPQILQRQGLGGLVLSELLFGEGRPNPQITNYVMRMVSAYHINLTNRELASVFDRKLPAAMYWILLTREAREAGIATPNEAVGKLLGKVIPQIAQNQTYPAVMSVMVSRYGMPESQILSIYGQMLSVLTYAQTICSIEDTSSLQLKQMASRIKETVDANWVELDAPQFSKLLDPNTTPTDEQIKAQFSRFKDKSPGEISADNPFGFGYKLPDRIQFDYMIVSLDDIKSTLKKPTQAEAEQYYEQNAKDAFTLQKPQDPNDPNAGTRSVIQPFSEVVQQIYTRITAEKAIQQANKILQEARSIADANLLDNNGDRISDVNILRTKAVDYTQLAQRLSKEYGVTISAGHTGFLSRADFMKDNLAQLIVYGRSVNGIALPQFLFQVEPIGVKNLTMLNVQPPRLFESIGPVKRSSLQENQQNPEIYGQIMALVRLVAVKPAQIPTSVDQSYDNTMSSRQASLTHTHFSVREQIISDLRTQSAFKLTEAKAQELSQAVKAKGWDQALAQFNQTYGPRLRASSQADPNIFKISKASKLARSTTDQLTFYHRRAQADPTYVPMYQRLLAKTLLVNHLYAMVNNQPSDTLQTQAVVPNAGEQKVYVVKTLALNPLTQEAFDQERASLSSQQDMLQAERLMVLHFSPDRIAARWNLKPTKPASDEEQTPNNAKTAQ